jgi:hypothetical protein
MGLNGTWEGEEGGAIASGNKGDLMDARLPQVQVEFLKKIRSKSNNPLIVVITGGAPIIIPEILELADAVIYAFYPGEQGGTALANIIFGDVSPSGRMPFTVPKTIEDLPPYENYAMDGRTYRYMSKEPLSLLDLDYRIPGLNMTVFLSVRLKKILLSKLTLPIQVILKLKKYLRYTLPHHLQVKVSLFFL